MLAVQFKNIRWKGNKMTCDEVEVYDDCDHIAIVSISDTECQCMDCLIKWNKEKNFKSDYPEYDRG